MKLFVMKNGADDSQFAPLLLLHGWALNHHVWQGVSQHFGSKYRCWALDLPGHGRSHAVRLARYDIDAVTDCIAEQMDESFIVLGWSLGAMIALNLTLRHPDRVERLITVAGTGQFVRSEHWPNGSNLDDFMLFADGVRNNYRSAIERFLAIQALGSRQALSQIKRLKQILFSEPDPSEQALTGGLDILKSTRLNERLHEISCPTWFVAGSSDKLIRNTASQASAALIAGAHYREIRAAGHAPFISHPMEFYAALEDAL